MMMAPSSIRTNIVAMLLAMAVVASGPRISDAQLPPVRDPVVAVPRAPIRILGVFDEETGQAVQGVEITDMSTGTSAVTTATGTVSLAFLRPGDNQIRVRKVGYAIQTLDVSISPSDSTPVTVVVKRVTELPTVVTKDAAPRYISPALRGFEERRKNATAGYFIPDSILRRSENRQLANVLMANAPGVMIAQRSSATFLTKSPRCSNGGQPDVYIDGVALAHLPDPRWPLPPARRNQPDTRDIPIDLSQFQVSSLSGIEFYPDNATMPVQFSRTSAGCGALFLWTRER